MTNCLAKLVGTLLGNGKTSLIYISHRFVFLDKKTPRDIFVPQLSEDSQLSLIMDVLELAVATTSPSTTDPSREAVSARDERWVLNQEGGFTASLIAILIQLLFRYDGHLLGTMDGVSLSIPDCAYHNYHKGANDKESPHPSRGSSP